MILINVDEMDSSLEGVIDWLDFYKADYHLINQTQSIIDFQSIEIGNGSIEFDKLFQLNSRINIYWNRNSLPIQFNLGHCILTNEERFEMNNLNRFINRVSEENAVNRFEDIFTNKLQNLVLASRIGLKIPKTIITSSRADLREFFYKNNGRVINKAIDTRSTFNKNERYTCLVNEGDISKKPEYFLPSLFQEYIVKKYELRVFYYYEKFYSMAIFSQLDNQTKIDFRNYNYEKPNRCVPYDLPHKVKSKLRKFMRLSNLNSGSFDLIYSECNHYFFLEVNPVGIFSPLTWPLNSTIEKDIAIHLINYKSISNDSKEKITNNLCNYF